MGACPPVAVGIFSKYTIFAVLNLYVFCSVEYSACVSGLDPTGTLPLDPAGGTSVLQRLPSPDPSFVPTP